MLLNDFITVVSINKGVVPNDQRREQLALFEDVFFKLLKFIIGQRRNLGLELRVDFQIDHTHTPLSLLLRLFFLPEKGRNILLCGFQLEQFLFGFLVLLVEFCLFGCQLRILGFQFLRAGQLGDIIRLTVEETNLLSIYNEGGKRALIENVNAALPYMDADMRELAKRTLSKVDALTEAEFAELPIYAADEV